MCDDSEFVLIFEIWRFKVGFFIFQNVNFSKDSRVNGLSEDINFARKWKTAN